MLNLSDGMLLYHGSYIAVPEIDLGKCNSGLDFGRGFYVTTSYEQALSFVPNSVKRNIRAGNIVFPFAHSLGRNKKHFRKFVLLYVFCFSVF